MCLHIYLQFASRCSGQVTSPVRPSATACLEVSPALMVVTTTLYRAPDLRAWKLRLLMFACTLSFLMTLLSWTSRTRYESRSPGAGSHSACRLSMLPKLETCRWPTGAGAKEDGQMETEMLWMTDELFHPNQSISHEQVTFISWSIRHTGPCRQRGGAAQIPTVGHHSNSVAAS